MSTPNKQAPVTPRRSRPCTPLVFRPEVIDLTNDNPTSFPSTEINKARESRPDSTSESRHDSTCVSRPDSTSESRPDSTSSTSDEEGSDEETRPSEDGPPAKIRNTRTEDQPETCPICLEGCYNFGPHRLVALKCGHLFGFSCVDKWIRDRARNEKNCPTCKRPAILKDIRTLYAKKIVAADALQLQEMEEKAEMLESEKTRLGVKLKETTAASRACVVEMEVLRNTLKETQTNIGRLFEGSKRLVLQKCLDVRQDEHSKILAYNSIGDELFVSEKGTRGSSYGVRVVNVERQLGEFVRLHSRPVRDMAYSTQKDLLLTVGLDGSVALYNSKDANTKLRLGFPQYSCAWDYDRHDTFYIGAMNGEIHQHDIRKSGSCIQSFREESDTTPMQVLQSTAYGLLSCQVKMARLWTEMQGVMIPGMLAMMYPFRSMSYDDESKRVVVYSEPWNTTTSQLKVCKLMPREGVLFEIQKIYVRPSKSVYCSKLGWVKGGGDTWVTEYSEGESMFFFHGVDGARSMAVMAHERVTDACSIHVNGDDFVATVGKSRLNIYKIVGNG